MAQEQLQQRIRRKLCRDRPLDGISGTGDDIAVRDSKDPNGSALTFTARQWRVLMRSVKAHEFDL